MIKLKSLLQESKGELLLSLLKPDRTVEKTDADALDRAQRQYAFGELGVGPKVFKIYEGGDYLVEKSPYPPLPESGGDIKEKMDIVNKKLFSMGVDMYDDHVGNIHFDNASGNFHIIDVGTMRLESSNEFKKIPNLKLSSELRVEHKMFFFENRSPIGSGEARSVFPISESEASKISK